MRVKSVIIKATNHLSMHTGSVQHLPTTWIITSSGNLQERALGKGQVMQGVFQRDLPCTGERCKAHHQIPPIPRPQAPVLHGTSRLFHRIQALVQSPSSSFLVAPLGTGTAFIYFKIKAQVVSSQDPWMSGEHPQHGM